MGTSEQILRWDALRGMAWTACGKVAGRAVQFAFGIILARLLVPADFGLVGVLGIFLGVSATFVDCGFATALIRKQVRSDADYSTVFFFSTAVSLAAYALLFAAAPYIADFYSLPQLTLVARVVLTGLVFGALSSVPQAILRLTFRFRALAVLNVIAMTGSGTLGVLLACKGLGVWALVWQGVAWNVFNVALLFAATKYVPRGGFSRDSFREFFAFGWRQLGASLVGMAYANAQTLALGRTSGAQDVGNYLRAESWAYLPPQVVYEVTQSVGLPAFSRIQNEACALRRGTIQLELLVLAFLILALGTLAIWCEPLVRLVLGSQWTGCVPLLRILLIGALLDPLVAVTTLPFLAKGRSDLLLKLETVEKGFGFALLFLCLDHGVLWVCVARSATPLFALVLNVLMLSRLLKYGND